MPLSWASTSSPRPKALVPLPPLLRPTPGGESASEDGSALDENARDYDSEYMDMD
ncbi:hypothetical protein K504DRAFT_505059 [Pleomassaria siparia CBS 279.74]|uniref:Uncharacterized protein n=1 Tax=Pleomassaria siparia CBS 279.74 TaxID=1314801 RepID=A0A6G1K0V6_9PLEO|nr:hypothetical protein K504DRAFT_505059 [Pleomassaria siparia CBS 279.74]